MNQHILLSLQIEDENIYINNADFNLLQWQTYRVIYETIT